MISEASLVSRESSNKSLDLKDGLSFFYLLATTHTHLSLVSHTMAQVQLTAQRSVATATSSSKSPAKAKSDVKSSKKLSPREQTRRQIRECAEKVVGENSYQVLPDTDKRYVMCQSTGHNVRVDQVFRIPLKAVKNVQTQLTATKFREQLPLEGCFISPVAALEFVSRNHSSILNADKLLRNIRDYYKLDEEYYVDLIEKLRKVSHQQPGKERDAAYHALIMPSDQNLYHVGGNISFHTARVKRPRSDDLSAAPSAKRARIAAHTDDDDAIAQSIEQLMTTASDEIYSRGAL